MSQLLLGLLIPIGGAAAVSLIVSLMSRYLTEGLGMTIGRAYKGWLTLFDIPIISGDSETKLKHAFLKTPLDVCRGFVKGVEEGEMPKVG